jgi:hypothetical protein
MPPARRHALLVGVDRYPNLHPHSQLKSCVNDARLMAEVLVERHGFHTDDVSLLLDEAATRDAILAGLSALQARAGSDDAVVFYYSGHGSQVEDREGDEPDGLDETIVPHDGGRPSHPFRDITDDEIYERILAISSVTRNLAMIFDTCFAGNVARGGPAPREKWIERDPRSRHELPPSPLPRRATRSATRKTAGPSGFLPLDERYVLLAACRGDQHAKELKWKPQSVFTFYLCRELQRAPAGATYRDVIERVRLAVAQEVQDQTPQVEGARDRLFFAGTARPPTPFLPVLARQDGSVEIGGGSLHGVGLGSVWTIHPTGTHRPSRATERGQVRIASVQAVRSRGEILEEAAPIEPGARAFERAKGPGWLRLPVRISGGEIGAPALRALSAAVGRSPFLRLCDDAGESGLVRIAAALPAAAAPDDGSLAPRIHVADPSWVALSAEDDLLLPPISQAQPDSLRQVVSNLETVARARNLLAIEDTDDDHGSLRAELTVDLLRRRGSGSYERAVEEACGEVVYLEEDRLALSITHHADRPLYLHVLDIGLAGAVTPLYPVRGANDPLIPGRPFEIATRPGQGLILRIPKEFAARARAAGQEQLEGREVLKVFATTLEADLSGWQQSGPHGARGGGRSAPSRLTALLDRALGGREARGGLPPRAEEDRWWVRTLSFLLRGEPRPAATSPLNKPR